MSVEMEEPVASPRAEVGAVPGSGEPGEVSDAEKGGSQMVVSV